ELLAQAPARALLALAQRLFALVHARFRLAQRLALARRQALVVLERPHVAVDLGQVLGELCLARREILARGGDDRRVEPEASGHFEREAAPGAAVEQLVGRREGVVVEAERGAGDPL